MFSWTDRNLPLKTLNQIDRPEPAGCPKRIGYCPVRRNELSLFDQPEPQVLKCSESKEETAIHTRRTLENGVSTKIFDTILSDRSSSVRRSFSGEHQYEPQTGEMFLKRNLL